MTAPLHQLAVQVMLELLHSPTSAKEGERTRRVSLQAALHPFSDMKKKTKTKRSQSHEPVVRTSSNELEKVAAVEAEQRRISWPDGGRKGRGEGRPGQGRGEGKEKQLEVIHEFVAQPE